YASHSVQVEAIRERLLAELAGIEPQTPTVPFFSAVTAERLEAPRLDAEYWYTNLRQTVRFEETIRLLLAQGFDAFVEASAHPVLTGAIEDTAEAQAVVVGTLRRGEGGQERFTAALAEAYVNGLTVDWTPLLGDGDAHVDLPTYAFQHQRYWPATGGSTAGDITSVGLARADHPLLGAAVRLAESDGVLLTGSLSLASHSWLAGHRVAGSVVLPGAAVVDLAIRAADETGCDLLEELLLEAPLTVPDQGVVSVQVRVERMEESEDSATYGLSIHSRAADADATEPWTRNATAVLATGAVPGADREATRFEIWPPKGAVPIDLDGFYEGLAEAGHGYDGLFRGLTAAWRLGDDIYAEVALPTDEELASGFAIHPALLDSALHGVALDGAADGRLRLPSRWAGVSLTATGATALRVRLAHLGPDEIAVELADQTGRPVMTVGSLVVRPVSIEEFQEARADHGRGMYRVDWVAATAPPSEGDVRSDDAWAVLGEPGTQALTAFEAIPRHPDLMALGTAIDAGSPTPEAVLLPCAPAPASDGADLDEQDLIERTHATAAGVLSVVREWLGDERFAGSRLAVVTRGAVGAGGGVPDVASSAVWGLVRSAATE
ncbi:acyltransferase domain-containing protein, partial [Streptomyces sp. NPDC017966]|uniref:acyltransferase domain-containing protein n=1 Tax=Streptomyces sp. NPDC017966 TaxID=3365023 RepID=UPI0037A81AEA